ncbi:hypothetical protein OH799_06660 [Nocardia sp. NBC_00881]|uniref:hypothetical protein n=1 Tax=Nocardia sp. NBC_00881 TaxID=2975995 RepID=UPI00386755FA|nr:hypothetical protein OH799_06660 [Nocardia sp. NBC_00881]
MNWSKLMRTRWSVLSQSYEQEQFGELEAEVAGVAGTGHVSGVWWRAGVLAGLVKLHPLPAERTIRAGRGGRSVSIPGRAGA